MPQCHDDYDLSRYPDPGPVPEARARDVACHDSYDPRPVRLAQRARRARRAAGELRNRAVLVARAARREDVKAGQ